jgi:hypothetical protein
MFSCSLVRTRAFPRALLLFVSLLFTLDAAADSGDYRARLGTLPGGLRVAEQVDAVTFPQFQGTRPASSSPDAPAVGAGHVRAIRVLLPHVYQQNYALALPDHSGYINVGFYNHHVMVEYGGPSVAASSSPFLGADRGFWRDGESKWTRYFPTPRGITGKISHFLLTLYVVPRLDASTRTPGTPNLVMTVEEATVHDMHVIRGKAFAENIALAVGEDDWSRWREKEVRAGMLPRDLPGPLALPERFTSRLPFVEQRTIALHDDPNEHRRDKRCLTDVAYHLTNLHTALLEVYFSRPDLCAFDPHPNQDIAAPLPLVEVIDPIDIPPVIEPTVFEAVALEPSQLQAPHAFDAAMNVQFCNSNHPEGAGDGACTDDDYRAAAALGELTPDRINTLLRQLALMHAADEPGPARLRSGKDDLDRWLNADLARAENALNAAQAVVHVSDARAEPTEPVKKKKKSRLLKASCVEPTPDTGASDDGFQQCVRDAKRKLREPEAVIAVTPAVHTNGDGNRFHLRGTPQFDRLVREFRNTGRGMPGGVAGDQFGGMTAAIARDGAPAGDNLGFIFINDPALRGGAARFPFGVEHIWAPGGGGGDNAGHRDDWTGLRGLPVNSRQMLIQVIMTALTDPNAQYEQRRTNNGNTIRTFRYFVFVHNNTLYAIRNIRIVLGKNGMVVTAYPVANAGAQPLAM